MVQDEDITIPQTTTESVSAAVRLILRAASHLARAADLAEEGTETDSFINSAIRLRDLATYLSPVKPDWPTKGAAIYDIRTKQKLN